MPTETKPTHTPGPWHEHEIAGNYYIENKDGYVIATIKKVQAYRRNHAQNARLVATATDLLEALELLVADVADYEAWQRPCHALDVARAALAHAKGEA